MPIEQHREKIGQFNNKSQKYMTEDNLKRNLSSLADSFGHYPVGRGVWSPTGILYLLSVGQNLRISEANLPNRQRAVQETTAAFEVDTFVEARQQGNETSLHSLVSSSTAAPQRFTPFTPNHSSIPTNSTIEVALPSNSLIYLVEKAHQWSIGLHKMAHRIAQVENCTTTSEIFHQNPLGLWNSANHTQAHFKTICQTAITKSQTTNEERKSMPASIQKFSFKKQTIEKTTHRFTAEEAAKKMKTVFESTVEEFYQTKNRRTKEKTKKHGTPIPEAPIVDAFWGELTELFTTFFGKPENATYTEQPADTNGYSVMDHLVEWLTQTFSVNHSSYDTMDSKINQNSNIPLASVLPDQSQTQASMAEPAVKEVVAEAISPLWELTNKLAEKLDHFIKKYDFLVTRGVEAAPIIGRPMPDQSTTVQTVEGNLEDQLLLPSMDSGYEQVIQIIEAISKNKKPTGILSPLPNFYYDELLSQRRNQTAQVNTYLKEFFVDQNLLPTQATDLELIKVVQRWAGMNWKNEESLSSARAQYLAYRILTGYGIENVRLGDFLSDIKLQSIYNQWKTNTLLIDYQFKEINEKTEQYRLSPVEDDAVIRLQNQKKINNQIYADFKHQRPETVSKGTKILAIYYHKNSFNRRSKTVEVNAIVEEFLYKHRIYLNKPTPEKLIYWLQKWIFNGKLYDEILQRELTAANLLLKAYGLTEKHLTVNMARAILLQWEENNAQIGYTYKKAKKKILGIDINKIKKDQEKERKEQMNQKIELFLRENNIDPPLKNLHEPVESSRMPSMNDQVMARQRVAEFLSEQDVACNASDPNVFAETVSNWILLEGATKDIIDMVKVKQIAQVILDEKVDGVISNEHAEITFTKWLWELIEADESLLTVVPRSVNNESILENSTVSTSTDINETTLTESPIKEEKKSKETANSEQWRSPKLLKQVENFFRNKGLLIGMATKEDVLSAMGRWFIEGEKQTVIMPEKVQAVASLILKELNLYGGGPDEMISDSSAERTVMKWAFENVLGSSIEAYIVKKIVDSPDPSAFTIGHLRKLLMFEELKKAGVINLSPPSNTLQQGNQAGDTEMFFRKLWISLSNRALPNYLLKSSNLSDNLLISDYNSLIQLTGESLMTDLGFARQFNQTEKQLLGEFFLETLSVEGIRHFEELSFLLTPALLTVAQLEPDKMQEALVKGNLIEVALTTFIGYSQRGYLQMMKMQAIADDLVLTYRQAVTNWRRKLVLVDEVLAECNRLGIRLDLAASQVYLAGGNPCPGPWIPPDLENWYTRLTKDVSESFHLLNEFLIQLSIQSIREQELDFIFSPDSRIYEASAQFKSEVRQYQYPMNLRSVPPLLFYKQEELLNSTLNLNQTDLIVVLKGNEERWYALKQVENGGYKFYRVDKDPFLFLTYGLMDQKDIWDGQFRKNGDMIRIGKKDYTFTTKVHTDKEFSRGDTKQTLANQISLKHRDALYQQLYDSGNEQTTATKVWNVLKHVIPFYDCVVGISEQNAEEAVPNCLIDAVSLIPLLGQVTTFNMRFALGVAKSVVKSGMSVTLKNSARFLPTLTELSGLIINTIRYLEPGVELIAGSGRFILKRLVKFSNEQFIGKELKAALAKLGELGSQQTDWTKKYVTARLAKDGPEVRVKRMSNHLYLRVNDLRNGDVFGKYFTLRGTQLREFEGPATFTPRQKVVIQRLSRTLDVDQVFVEEPNLNPKAYGEGNVFTFKKRDGQRVSVLQMDGHMIPVEITVLKKHGVRYDVSDGEKLLPVNFNGIEWYFEPSTSPMVRKPVEIDITNRINQFEALWDPSILSPPDERGLMWNAEGRSYIRINDRYLPLILLDKDVNRYHLVKKDILETMTILRFDPINRSFRFETELEKQAIDIQNQIRRAGESDEVIPGTSSGTVGTSQGEKTSQQVTPSYPLLPNTPGKWEEWNKIREAVAVFTDPLPRTVDKNVEPKKLTTFIPEPQVEVMLNEESMRQSISEVIAIMYHSQPVDYKVFSGLDLSKVPDYLQPYLKELSDGFYEAINYFKTTKERCIELLKLDNIAETPEGKYAVEMFDMHLIKNREPYLREIFKRLLSVSEKGERFLRQSADWGFKNIWIVSTELEKNEAKQVFYSKVEAIPEAYAFMMSHDPECRIIFIADMNHIDPDYMPKLQISVDPKETLIHETTHIMSMTYDVISSYPYMVSGYSKSGADVRNQYFRKYPGFFKTEEFTRFVDQLADYQNSPMLSEEAVILAEKTDAMMSMNIQSLDAETLTIIIRDIALGNPFNKRPINQRPKLFKRDLSNQQNKPKINGEMLVSLALMNSGQFNIAERNLELGVTKKPIVQTTASPLPTSTPNKENTNQQGSGQDKTKQSKKNQNKKNQKKPRINKLVGFSTKISGFVNEGQVNTSAKKKSDLNLQK